MNQTQTAFSEYLAALRKNLAHGDATEHTHRPALQRLVEALAPGLTVINEARRIACGAPDFTLRQGTVPLAHIETKDVGTPLDEVIKGRGAHGAQFKRYQSGLPNWILTDYLRFDWFVGGQFRKRAMLATVAAGGKLIPMPGGAEEVEHLLRSMLEPEVATVETARELARRMAGIAHNLRDLIDTNYKGGSHSVVAWLSRWIASFRETLIPELKEDEFADMFAQTLAYGLFAARIQTAKTGAKFSRAEALFAVPKSNPFLRKIFSELGGAEMPDEFDWALDDLVHLLERADIGRILADFGRETGQNDPIVHFYETFLAAYDPKLREKRGVYYTPAPVVRYIVRSVDSLLKTHFGKPKGLADEKTLILDPATGTATFLYFVIEQIRESMAGQRGAWPGYVRNHLLKRIFGFELLMAPYAVAHLKLGLQLEETGYAFGEGERLGIYLTNTLEEAAKKSERIVAGAISDEANAAADIKRKEPILVVLGNPPYAGISANRSRKLDGGLTFIGSLIETYKLVDGVALRERKTMLQDDYVKFMRFAQWRLERTGHGLLAFITNNGYLDNPTFRGMRASLISSFDEIFILDLHGSSNKRERGPAGQDENVFDIQQGVAIFIGVRKLNRSAVCNVRHAEMWGTRAAKYAELDSNSTQTTAWAQLSPSSPNYWFVPAIDPTEEYALMTPVTKVFTIGGSGMTTARDTLAIHFQPEELLKTVVDFTHMDAETARISYSLGPDSDEWQVELAQRDLARSKGTWNPVKVLYRPYDPRFTILTGRSKGFVSRPIYAVMRHMLSGRNLGLIVTRTATNEWCVSVSDMPICHKAMAGYDRNQLFPLFTSEQGNKEELFAEERSNLAPAFVKALAIRLGVAVDSAGVASNVSSEDIFHYIYGIFHSPGYRARYAEFLKRDFPRVPLTSSLDLFGALVAKGRELVALHLLKVEDAPQLDRFITTYPVAGSDEVLRVKYDTDKRRVLINDEQFFEEVPAETWAFTIGGYQVCEKWLKDRKGRVLTYEDQQHWQRVVVALTETRRLMAEIDDIIPGWPLN